jgi:hypothetical protein
VAFHFRQAGRASRGAFPGAGAVWAELVQWGDQFQKLPVGPVGSHLRADANLAGLLEAELSQQLLKAYLVDNSLDGALLANVLDAQCGATSDRPMEVTSRFLSTWHPWSCRGLGGGQQAPTRPAAAARH